MKPSYEKRRQPDSNYQSSDYKSNALTTPPQTAAAESRKNLSYLCILELALTLSLGEEVNYLTLRVQFYANKHDKRRDTNP